jgi:hypothetical protein
VVVAAAPVSVAAVLIAATSATSLGSAGASVVSIVPVVSAFDSSVEHAVMPSDSRIRIDVEKSARFIRLLQLQICPPDRRRH